MLLKINVNSTCLQSNAINMYYQLHNLSYQISTNSILLICHIQYSTCLFSIIFKFQRANNFKNLTPLITSMLNTLPMFLANIPWRPIVKIITCIFVVYRYLEHWKVNINRPRTIKQSPYTTTVHVLR